MGMPEPQRGAIFIARHSNEAASPVGARYSDLVRHWTNGSRCLPAEHAAPPGLREFRAFVTRNVAPPCGCSGIELGLGRRTLLPILLLLLILLLFSSMRSRSRSGARLRHGRGFIANAGAGVLRAERVSSFGDILTQKPLLARVQSFHVSFDSAYRAIRSPRGLKAPKVHAPQIHHQQHARQRLTQTRDELDDLERAQTARRP
jgi:hypothetical protein